MITLRSERMTSFSKMSLPEPEKWGAFVEYVVRPMTEDWRLILDRMVELKLVPTQENLKAIGKQIAMAHVVSECVRAAVAITIAWLVCRAAVAVL